MLSGLGGAVVAVLGTAVQQAVWRIGTAIEIPWGLVLAEALMVAYLIGVRLRFDSRVPVLAAGGIGDGRGLVAALARTGALAYARERAAAAARDAARCLDGVAPSPAAQTLLQLTGFAVDRRF